MPDYSKGKIYTIRCRTDDSLIYVGSTIQPLCERLASHKKNSKTERDKNTLIYKTINGDWDNWYIELHSLCPCNSKEELFKKEGEITREISTLNMNVAGRTQKEYYHEHKEQILEQQKKYYEENKEKILTTVNNYKNNNKEKISEKKKEKITCECGCILRKDCLKKHQKSQKHFRNQKSICSNFKIKI
jgi:hypothetical protein